MCVCVFVSVIMSIPSFNFFRCSLRMTQHEAFFCCYSLKKKKRTCVSPSVPSLAHSPRDTWGREGSILLLRPFATCIIEWAERNAVCGWAGGGCGCLLRNRSGRIQRNSKIVRIWGEWGWTKQEKKKKNGTENDLFVSCRLIVLSNTAAPFQRVSRASCFFFCT